MKKLHVHPYWRACRFSFPCLVLLFDEQNRTELILASMQKIWDEVGETNEERDKVRIRLDRDCLDVYKREFDQAVKSRAHLLHNLVDAKEKLTNLLSLLGEETCVGIVSSSFDHHVIVNEFGCAFNCFLLSCSFTA